MDALTRPITESFDAIRLISIAIIFFISLFAAGFPIAAQRLHFLRVPSLLFFIGKHFGTGVILSTAFVHLLADAFSNLNGVKVAGLADLPGLITLGSLLLIFLIEYTSTVYVETIADVAEKAQQGASPHPPHDSVQSILDATTQQQHTHDTETSPLLARQEAQRDAYLDVYMHHHDHTHQNGHCVEKERRDKLVQLLGVLVLQLGIMLHSFVIGMTLAVTTPSHLPSLLTAIIFHQLFEGLSLGVRFSCLPTSIPRSPASPSSTPRCRSIRYVPHILTFLFAITTPVGIIVGLIIKSTIQSQAVDTIPGGSTFRGVMAAISAGLLIYASCVELLAGDFVNDVDLRKSSKGRQTTALLSLICGAIAMALIR
ncbi:hypothetical protein FRB94_010179 [Tulasnella sp. JGI-2019a]|nr:hypothetical protein FRB93_003237 [Tulasnella sp. JGI-2019a]KAG8994079.1 hypothetical protein FRB94_010179 [Tulasnella sp. JGI-2019a]KAG9033149.1 hypothetical protein FRB95_000491 [Tulasnella sp. JGI-2019a]